MTEVPEKGGQGTQKARGRREKCPTGGKEGGCGCGCRVLPSVPPSPCEGSSSLLSPFFSSLHAHSGDL